jgi:hypothetical protein
MTTAYASLPYTPPPRRQSAPPLPVTPSASPTATTTAKRGRRPRRQQALTTDQLYTFLASFISAHGYAPSYKEMAEALDLRSQATPAYHVRKLVAEGRIEHTPRTARGLRLLGVANTPA